MDAPDLIAVADGSCSRCRRFLGWNGKLLDPSDTSVPITSEDGNFHASTVTPCMAEMASIFTALSVAHAHIAALGLSSLPSAGNLAAGSSNDCHTSLPLRIYVFNDCMPAVEASVLFDPDDLRSKGAPHLVPLSDAIRQFKLELTGAGHTVIIRRPHRGREAKLMKSPDHAARRARMLIEQGTHVDGVSVTLRLALEDSHEVLNGLTRDQLQIAMNF